MSEYVSLIHSTDTRPRCFFTVLRASLSVISLFAALIAFGPYPASASERPVTIGIQESLDPDFFVNTMGPTLRTLRDKNPGRTFRTEVLSMEGLTDAIKNHQIDFFMSDSGFFSYQALESGATNVAARSVSGMNPGRSTSAVVFVRSDRSGLQSIGDLKGKTVVSQDPNDFSSWVVFQGEVAKAGFDPDKFWGRELFTHYDYPNVVDAVLSGDAYVGILKACDLEKQLTLHAFKPDAFRVIREQTDKKSACRRSAPLYPGVVFAALPYTDPALVKATALTLLAEKPAYDGTVWAIANDSAAVTNLYKVLKSGPYAYLKEMNWEAFWEKYRYAVYVLAALILLWAAHTVRVNRLVDIRTRELRESMAEKERLEKENQMKSQTLSQLERAGTVSQMSLLVAHELRQPLTSLMNFAGGLRLYLSRIKGDDPTVTETTRVIEEEAVRASDIVEKVRRYAKQDRPRPVPVTIEKLVNEAVRLFSRTSAAEGIHIEPSVNPDITVLGDPMELELVLVNLLKNSAAAMRDETDKRITIRVLDLGNDTASVEVTDNGVGVSEEKLQSLSRPVTSLKPDGLGLGLSLARSIIERHGGHIGFRREKRGLTVTVTLPTIHPAARGSET